MKQRIGKYLAAFGLGCGALETAYFGWNAFPKSGAELAADIICFAVVLLGWFLARAGNGEATKA